MKTTNEKIIHSTLHEVLRLGTDSDFPSPHSSIGLILKRKQFGGVDITIHTPRLSSLIEGEILELSDSDLDLRIRRELLNLADNCQELAEYLLSEKKRLEDYAEKKILIYESAESIESESASKNRAKIEQIEQESSKPTKTARPSSAPDIDLDLFS